MCVGVCVCACVPFAGIEATRTHTYTQSHTHTHTHTHTHRDGHRAFSGFERLCFFAYFYSHNFLLMNTVMVVKHVHDLNEFEVFLARLDVA